MFGWQEARADDSEVDEAFGSLSQMNALKSRNRFEKMHKHFVASALNMVVARSCGISSKDCRNVLQHLSAGPGLVSGVVNELVTKVYCLSTSIALNDWLLGCNQCSISIELPSLLTRQKSQ